MASEHGRLRWYEPAQLDSAQRALYDRITSGPRAAGPQAFALTDPAGRLNGPFNALLLAPEVGTAVAELGSAIRYRTSLSDRAREIAILELAVVRRCEFEWYAHARIGAAIGLSLAELAGLHAGEVVATFDRTEALVRSAVREIVLHRTLGLDVRGDCEATLGQPMLMELVALVGYYDLLALSLDIWNTPLPAGAQPVFDSARIQ